MKNHLPTLVLLLLAACSSTPGARMTGSGSGGAASGGSPGSSAGGKAAISNQGSGGVHPGGGTGGRGTGGTHAATGGAAANNAGGSSNAGGINGQAPSGGAAGAPVVQAPEGQLTWVAVGYAGRRVRSVDLGITWNNDQTLGGGGDDEFLLRGVAFGKGLFVAVGWKIHSSADGITWHQEVNPQNQWLQGIRFSGERWVATGGYGYSAYSTDGHAWQPGGDLMTEASRSLAFGEGIFMTATNPGNWWSSTDGMNWAKVSSGHQDPDIAYCNGQFKETKDCTDRFTSISQVTLENVTVRAKDGKLERSSNGIDFEVVQSDGPALIAVTAGYVIP